MATESINILDASSRESTDFERVHVMDGWVMKDQDPAPGWNPALQGPRHFIGDNPEDIDFGVLEMYLNFHLMGDGGTLLQDIESWPLNDGNLVRQSHSVMMHKVVCGAIKRIRPDIHLTCFSCPVPSGRAYNLRGWWNHKAERWKRIVEACESVIWDLDSITVPVYWYSKSPTIAIDYARRALSLANQWRAKKPIRALICPRVVKPLYGNERWQDNPQIEDRHMRKFLASGVLPFADELMVWDSSSSEDWQMGDWGLG